MSDLQIIILVFVLVGIGALLFVDEARHEHRIPAFHHPLAAALCCTGAGCGQIHQVGDAVMFISFQRETSGTTLGGDKPLSRSHMREWGHSPRNYKTQCSAAFDPEPVFLDPPLPTSQFLQALLDVGALLAAFLLVTATGLGIAFAVFVLLFVNL